MSTADVSFITSHQLKVSVVKSFCKTILWLSNLARDTVVIIVLVVAGVIYFYLFTALY